MATADLRPMTLGEVLDRTFTLYRENFPLFAGITALPYLLLLLFRFGILVLTHGQVLGGNQAVPSPAAIGGAVAGAFGGGLLALFIMGLAQSATVAAVSALYLGNPTSVGEAYANTKGKFLSVIGVIILSGLATLVGMLFLIIPGIYLACRLAVSVPVTVAEDESPVSSMERSMELTKGYGWQMFLLLLLVFVLAYVVSMVLQFPVMFFSVTAAMAKHQVSAGVQAYSYVAEYASQVLVGPIGTISACLMYYNLRVKKEGFDIQHLMNTLGSVPRPLADLPANQ